MNAIRRWICVLVLVVGCIACVPFLYVGVAIGIQYVTTRPGIGPVEKAQEKIQAGMTKNEVRAVLGHPHLPRENAAHNDEWDYWESRFVGSVLRIHFGPDGRVTDSEWWVQ